jgi:hypothetical protein
MITAMPPRRIGERSFVPAGVDGFWALAAGIS